MIFSFDFIRKTKRWANMPSLASSSKLIAAFCRGVQEGELVSSQVTECAFFSSIPKNALTDGSKSKPKIAAWLFTHSGSGIFPLQWLPCGLFRSQLRIPEIVLTIPGHQFANSRDCWHQLKTNRHHKLRLLFVREDVEVLGLTDRTVARQNTCARHISSSFAWKFPLGPLAVCTIQSAMRCCVVLAEEPIVYLAPTSSHNLLRSSSRPTSHETFYRNIILSTHHECLLVKNLCVWIMKSQNIGAHLFSASLFIINRTITIFLYISFKFNCIV